MTGSVASRFLGRKLIRGRHATLKGVRVSLKVVVLSFQSEQVVGPLILSVLVDAVN